MRLSRTQTFWTFHKVNCAALPAIFTERREQQGPQRKHRNRHSIVWREYRMSHEEEQVQDQIAGDDETSRPCIALAIETQDQDGPESCDDKQDELHIGEVLPKHIRVDLGRRDVNAAIGR